MTQVSNDDALEAALAAADAAARSLIADFKRNKETSGKGLDSWMKSPGALVTEADIAADRAITDALLNSAAGRRVGASVLSEESEAGDRSSDATWLVDPLCGTVPFYRGMAHWGVNIALRRGDALSVGVIATPQSGQVLVASAGNGVTLDGKPFEARDPGTTLDESVVGLEVDGGDWARLLESDGHGGLRLAWLGSLGYTNTFASAAYPLFLVCTGGMSGVVFYRIDSVHLAAGALIAKELGATVSDEHGEPLDWLSEDSFPVAVVAWPSVHADLIAAMNRT